MVAKTVLVTGGNRGIGLATVKALSNKGFTVLMGCRDIAKGEELAKRLGENVHAIALDLSNAEQLQAQLDAISQRFNQIDVVINNAGVLDDTNYLDLTPEQLFASLQTNSIAPLQLMQHFGAKMKQNNGGRIINVSSGWGASSGILDAPAAYGISKSCLNTLTQLAAQALGNKVDVSAVCPGWVRTDMGGSSASRSPEQGADTIVWLATTEEKIQSGKFYRDRKVIPW